jgi:hypothetical protein
MPKTKIKNDFYSEGTSKKMRKLGDSLLAISMMGVPAVLSNHQWIGISLFVSGVAGKFLTNLFTDIEDKEEENVSNET